MYSETESRSRENTYVRQLMLIALPVALQSLLQSSFSIIDQMMVGQLGATAISGVGIGGRFSSIFMFTAGAIVSAAGIMISQFLGQKNEKSLAKSFWISLAFSLTLALVFLGTCLFFPEGIAGLYIQDPAVIETAASYLRIYAFSFIPVAVVNMYSVMLRCMDKAYLPLMVTVGSVFLNTFLNACFIFGLFGFPRLGAVGVAAASVTSMIVSLLVLHVLFKKTMKEKQIHLPFSLKMSSSESRQYFKIVLPLVATEFLWVLGENVYGGIYGHLGTSAFTAMTITTTIIQLIMGALSGLSQAAGIMVGRALGEGRLEHAYELGKKLIRTGLMFSIGFAILCVLLAPLYVSIYAVDETTRQTAVTLLCIFAAYAPIKTTNMINTGGNIRAGGKTKYSLILDFCGTWCVGVPLGLLSESLGLSIPWVYGILSLEELVRMSLGLYIFRKRIWMQTLHEV